MRRRNKFSNIRVEVDGLKFDSKGEAAQWQTLKLRERAGEIHSLERQVRYPLSCGGKLICHYIADFTYSEQGKLVVLDFKSEATMTDAFRLKAKLFEANYGFPITIMTKKGIYEKKKASNLQLHSHPHS
jgi:hypothetical protein